MTTSTAGHDPLIGQILGHYRLEEPIGAGGMGKVYRAHDNHLDREVAIKVLPYGILSDEKSRHRFHKEALTLSKLNHPNIATIYDFDTHSGLDFLVMEFIAGETLSDKLAESSLPEKQALGLAIQLAEGMSAAHAHGIIHCDLKPGNLRINTEGRLKILDFGLAKLRQAVSLETVSETFSECGEQAGTLPYMAPEQIVGGELDARTDIHATGAVLYEMVTGHRAFHAAERSQLTNKILRSAPRPAASLNPRLSPEMGRIIGKCLEKEPEDRYQSARELCIDLRRLQTATLSGVQPLVLNVPRLRRKTVAWTLVGVAVLVGLIFALRNEKVSVVMRGVSGTPKMESLAVLPLVNLSGDPQEEYFADGMTEELITNLGKVAALRVISRTSVMQYKETKKTLPSIAGELNVDEIVEGSVLRSGNRVRVTAKLIEAKEDRQLWAESYERNSSDILALQGEVAQAIAAQIRVKLTPQEHQLLAARQAVNPAAYEAYMRGRYHANKTSEEELRKAKSFYEQAIAIDAKYAPPYVGLADSYVETDELTPEIALPKAAEYAEKALSLDETLAEAHLSLGDIQSASWNGEGAEQHFRRALELNPSYAEAHRRYASYLVSRGRKEEALQEIRSAKALDPLSNRVMASAGWVAYFSRDFEQAREECQRVLNADPENVTATDCVGSAYLGMGKYDEALAACKKAISLSGNDPPRAVCLVQAYVATGKREAARGVLEEMEREAQRKYIPPFILAEVHASLGENEQALKWLEKSCRERDPYLLWFNLSPAVDALRAEPGTAELMNRCGLTP